MVGLALNGLFLLGALVLGVAWGRAAEWGRKRDGNTPVWGAPPLATAHKSHGQEQKLAPSEGEDWIVPGIGMEFVWIAALNCWVGKYEVTNSECRGFKPDHGGVPRYKEHSLGADRQPVVYVSYGDAVVYAERLTERKRQAGRLPDGMEYRLPDGNEWTALAQCGDGRQYPWGNEWPPKYGNYCDQSSASPFGKIDDGYDDGFPVTCPVEKSGENDWGLYGVGGNVWEWTSELHAEWKTRALRGASWVFYGKDVTRCKHRYFWDPSAGHFETGFRLLLSR